MNPTMAPANTYKEEVVPFLFVDNSFAAISSPPLYTHSFKLSFLARP